MQKGYIMSKNQEFKQGIVMKTLSWAFTETKRQPASPNQTALDNVVDNMVFISIVIQKAITRWVAGAFILNHSAHFLGVDLKSWVDSFLEFFSLWK